MNFEKPEFLAWTFPLLVTLSLAELWLIRRRAQGSYASGETWASIGVGLGQQLTNKLGALLMGGVYLGTWQHRWWEVPLNTAWGVPLLVLGVEFCYYWHHRLSHEVRWFWATHSVHHSPQHFNLSAAYRLGWTGTITGHGLFYLPLIALGFHPAAVFGVLLLNLLYQFWLHTEQISSLGWFDRWFNSPSNHRVHHATNARYLDANYGGITMLWDHLFGSYVPERADDPPRYGLITQVNSHNPLRIAFHEWIRIAQDLRASTRVRDALGYLFGPPGWKPNGQSYTSWHIQRDAGLLRPEAIPAQPDPQKTTV
jgi:sterol desaturase/sphingolipid hydroxylase (fatty acid hydroxylase superfamily)